MSDLFASLLALVDDISTLIPEQKYIDIMNAVNEIYHSQPIIRSPVWSVDDLSLVRSSRDNFRAKYKRERRRVNCLRKAYNDARDELEEEIATLAETNRRLRAQVNLHNLPASI